MVGDPRDDLTDYIRTKDFNANTMLALRQLINDIGNETALYKELKNVPRDKTRNFRNDMYVVSEALRLVQKTGTPTFHRRRPKSWPTIKSTSISPPSSFPPG